MVWLSPNAHSFGELTKIIYRCVVHIWEYSVYGKYTRNNDYGQVFLHS